jgi:hypothetical protein
MAGAGKRHLAPCLFSNCLRLASPSGSNYAGGMTSLRTIGCCCAALLLAVPGCVRAPATPHAANKPVIAAEDLRDGDALRQEIDEVLSFTDNDHELNTQVHAAWQILHGVLVYGRQFKVRHEGALVPAVDWTLAGGRLKGWDFEPGRFGPRALLELGSASGQGHDDQWLGYISQCDLPAETALHLYGETPTIRDWVEQVKYDVPLNSEYSWTVIALTKYLADDLDQTWTARDGETWSLDRLMQFEADAARDDLEGGACGGTHRTIGMSIALDRYRRAYPDRELTGGWLAAKEQIDRAVDLAFDFQNPDGSFSTAYFARFATNPDVANQLGSTGHVLEFLAITLPEDELDSEPMLRAVAFLCDLFHKTRNEDLECGALYHAAHGLAVYRERRWGK